MSLINFIGRFPKNFFLKIENKIKELRLPKISIIIPVRNAARTMDKMYEYLMALDYPHEKMEIIIADGGSDDGTMEIIQNWHQKFTWILVEIKDCKSPGQARNEALKVVTGEYVLFTDGDCAPAKDWVTKILEPFFMDSSIGAVGGEVLTLRAEEDNLTESYCEQVKFLSPTGRCQVFESGYMPPIKKFLPHEVNGGDNSPFFATANVAYSRPALKAAEMEFWPEKTGEDVDLAIRVEKAGFKHYYQKEALVLHMHRVNLKAFQKQWHGYGFGHPLLVEKHAQDKILEIVFQYGRQGFSLGLPWPGKGIIHIGKFHLMHLFGLLALISAFLNFSGLWTKIWALLFVLFLGAYFWPCLKLKPRRYFFSWCKIRYLTNWSFIKGALDGMKEFGTICVEPSW